jgi:galactan endo-1,6-beta-galactosidase
VQQQQQQNILKVSVVNPSVSFGAWEGWGTSLCWWANVAGEREDYLDLIFTLNR